LNGASPAREDEKMATEKLLIKIVEHPMTDGSKVHNVVVVDNENRQSLDFAAYTEKSAIAFAEGLRKLIDEHTLITDVWTA
jgi:hypothetical protein